MAVMKPQKPLLVNEQEIYPLTCAEQVIMDDGSRFNVYVKKFLVPSYTSADYGKILGCDESGLQWVDQQSELENVEEAMF